MPSGIPQVARIHPALAAAAASENPRFVSGYAFRHTASCENPSGFSRCRRAPKILDSYQGMPSGIPQLARIHPALAAAAPRKILDSYQGMPSGIPQLARIHPALAAAAASRKILDSYQGMPSGIPQLARIRPALATAAASEKSSIRIRVCLQAYRSLRESIRL